MPWVESPKTGRPIRVGGETYEKLKTSSVTMAAKLKKAKKVSAPANASKVPRTMPAGTRVSAAHMKAIRALPVAKKRTVAQSQKDKQPPYLRRKLSVQRGRQGDARGAPTRGWAADAPKTGTQRHKLKAACGNTCFLAPGQEKFPICRKCGTKTCSCAIDCRGVLAARIRARQYGNRYPGLSSAAEKIQAEKCPQHYHPSPKKVTKKKVTKKRVAKKAK